MRLKILSLLLVQFVVTTSIARSDNLDNSKNSEARSEGRAEKKSEAKEETKEESTEFSVSKAAVDGILSTVSAPTTMQLDQIERDAFSHAYSSDTTEQRICRLEQFVFGKQFKGDLSARFKKLRKH